MDDLREQIINLVGHHALKGFSHYSFTHEMLEEFVDDVLLPLIRERDSKRDAYIIGEDEVRPEPILHAPYVEARIKLRAEQRKRAKDGDGSGQ